jgi:membrane associated rhomboid family serine protease
MAATDETGGVAYGAHIGGFLTGMALGLVMRMAGTTERPSAFSGATARPDNRRLG